MFFPILLFHNVPTGLFAKYIMKGETHMNLNPTYAVDYAKALTTTAMEHSMIAASRDPKETAQNVVDFFNTIYDALTENESED